MNNDFESLVKRYSDEDKPEQFEVVGETLIFKDKKVNVSAISCPMCAVYGEKRSLDHIEYKGAHIFTCPECVCVMVEYHDNKDLFNFTEYFLGG